MIRLSKFNGGINFRGLGKVSELYVVAVWLREQDQNKWYFHNQHLPNDRFGEREKV